METTMGARLTTADIPKKFINHVVSENSPWKSILLEGQSTRFFSDVDICILRRLQLKRSVCRVSGTLDLNTFEIEVGRKLDNHKAVASNDYKKFGLHRYADLEFAPALHIEEANMLSRGHFYFMDELLKNSSCSFIYLSTNNGICEVRDMEIRIPNQIPSVFLPKMIVAKPTEVPFSPVTFFWSSTEACKFLTPVVDMIRLRKLTKCVILLTGPVCAGKTQIAFQISQELGSEVEFHQMFTSTENKSTMPIADNLRRAVAVRLRQDREIYEGEVTEVLPKEIDSGSITIGLKTEMNAKHLKLKRPVSDSLIKEKVAPGDVIQIDIRSGAVIKMCTSDELPLPKGDVYKKQIVQDITLYDLYKDFAGGQIHDVSSLLLKKLASGNEKSDKAVSAKDLGEITDKMLESYSNEKVFEIRRGVLFIDEVHDLDDLCIDDLCNFLENSNSLSPILIIGTDQYETRCCQNIKLKELKPMVIIHTKSCVPADSIEELNSKTPFSLAALEKEVKLVEIYVLINNFFGATSIISIALGATNSSTTTLTMGFLIGVLVSCGSCLLYYAGASVILQCLIEKVKKSDDKEVWIEKSEVLSFKRKIFSGFVANTIGICWVFAAVLSFL